MKRRHLILLLGGSSAGMMTVGSGAFSSAEAERGVSVSVVDDEHALVGYDNASDPKGERHVTESGRIELVTVENRFANEVELSVPELSVTPHSGDYPDIDEDSLEFSEEDGHDAETIQLGPGQSETIHGIVDCNGETGRATVELTVRVEGGGVSAELFGDAETREFEIVCADVVTHTTDDDVDVEGVAFDESGNAEVLSPDDGEVDVREYYVGDDGVERTDFESVSLGEGSSISDETLAGVEIEGVDGVFVRPEFTGSDCDVTPSSDDASGSENGNGVSEEAVRDPVALEDDPFGEDCFSTDD